MRYEVSNGLIEVVQDKLQEKLTAIKEIILDFCEKNRKIPSIEEFNNYQKQGITINEFLIAQDLEYPNFIRQFMGLKESKKGGVYQVDGIKEALTIWLDEYYEQHGTMPSYKECADYVKILTYDDLFSHDMKKFLKEFGIKQNKQRYPVIRHLTKGKEHTLKVVDNLLEKDVYVFVATKKTRHVIKYME